MNSSAFLLHPWSGKKVPIDLVKLIHYMRTPVIAGVLPTKLPFSNALAALASFFFLFHSL